MERESLPALNPAESKAAPAALALPVPANLIDFMAMYGTEDDCLETLIAASWPKALACPRCGHGKDWRHANRRLIERAACGHQTSPMAGYRGLPDAGIKHEAEVVGGLKWASKRFQKVPVW